MALYISVGTCGFGSQVGGKWVTKASEALAPGGEDRCI